MKNLTCPLQNAIWQSLKDNPNIALVIAYSGGVDSQVLLHALVQLKHQAFISNPITVCHVNHGLSDNAKTWQQFAENACSKYGVQLVVKSVNIKAQAQQSLEELARDARYDALNTISDNPALILTGHHSDDQSETFLLALKRGAGLKGLSAMSEISQRETHRLVRPLLSISRQTILDYAKAHQLRWIEDESNTDISFDRNFIRNNVMPLLKQRWPSISQTINRSAAHCLEGQELLDELAEQDLVSCESEFDEPSLLVEPLLTLSKARFNNLIRFFLSQKNSLMPSTEQLKQLRSQLNAASDKTPSIKVGNCFFRRFKEAIYLTPHFEDISRWQHSVSLVDGSEKIMLPDNLGQLTFTLDLNVASQLASTAMTISLPKAGDLVSIRFTHDNPKCLPDYRQHTRTVKKVLQELNIPPWQRKRIAFLYYNEELVAGIGHFICQPFINKGGQDNLFIYQSS